MVEVDPQNRFTTQLHECMARLLLPILLLILKAELSEVGMLQTLAGSVKLSTPFYNKEEIQNMSPPQPNGPIIVGSFDFNAILVVARISFHGE